MPVKPKIDKNKSDILTLKLATNKPLLEAERRNARERKRVESVNDAFKTLQSHLPELYNRKRRVSKLKVLQSALDYMYLLSDELEGSGGIVEVCKMRSFAPLSIKIPKRGRVSKKQQEEPKQTSVQCDEPDWIDNFYYTAPDTGHDNSQVYMTDHVEVAMQPDFYDYQGVRVSYRGAIDDGYSMIDSDIADWWMLNNGIDYHQTPLLFNNLQNVSVNQIHGETFAEQVMDQHHQWNLQQNIGGSMSSIPPDAITGFGYPFYKYFY